MRPANFHGPAALVTGPLNDASITFAGALVLRYANDAETRDPQIEVQSRTDVWQVAATRDDKLDSARTLAEG